MIIKCESFMFSIILLIHDEALCQHQYTQWYLYKLPSYQWSYPDCCNSTGSDHFLSIANGDIKTDTSQLSQRVITHAKMS